MNPYSSWPVPDANAHVGNYPTMEIVSALRALGNRDRLRVMSTLLRYRDGSMTSSTLAATARMSPTRAEGHIRALRSAGLIESRYLDGIAYHRASIDRFEAVASTLSDLAETTVSQRVTQITSDPVRLEHRSPGRPRRDELDSREQILLATRLLITDTGFAAMTMAEVAQLAGVSRPLVAYYFTSKATLYQAALAELREAFSEFADPAFRSTHHGSIRDELEDLVSAILLRDGDTTALGLLASVVVDSHRHPELQPEAPGMIDLLRGRITAITSHDVESNGSGDAMVESTIALVLGLSVYAGFGGAREDITRQTIQLWLSVLDCSSSPRAERDVHRAPCGCSDDSTDP